MSAKLVPHIRRIAAAASKRDEVAILALLALCKKQHRALGTINPEDGITHGNFGDISVILAAGREAGLQP